MGPIFTAFVVVWEPRKRRSFYTQSRKQHITFLCCDCRCELFLREVKLARSRAGNKKHATLPRVKRRSPVSSSHDSAARARGVAAT